MELFADIRARPKRRQGSIQRPIPMRFDKRIHNYCWRSLQWNPFFLFASAFFPAASMMLRVSVFVFSFLPAFKRGGNDAVAGEI
jgi:hypothetical protein